MRMLAQRRQKYFKMLIKKLKSKQVKSNDADDEQRIDDDINDQDQPIRYSTHNNLSPDNPNKAQVDE